MDPQTGLVPSRDPRLVVWTPVNGTTHRGPLLPAWHKDLQGRDYSKYLGDNFTSLDDEQDLWKGAAPQDTLQRDTTKASGSSTPGVPSLVGGFSGVAGGQRVATANRSVIDLRDTTDDELLRILLKNETLANRFQRACTSRLEQHQRDLENAYNQRLSDLEKYTREWRDHTEELWLALKDEKFPPITRKHEQFLAWPGPQQMAHGLEPVSLPRPPSLDLLDAQPRTELRGSDDPTPTSCRDAIPGPVINHRSGLPIPHPPEHSVPQSSQGVESPSAKAVQEPLQSQSHGTKWVDDTEGFKHDNNGRLTKGSLAITNAVLSRSLGPDFERFLKIREPRRMVVKYVDEEGRSTYRDINAIHSVLGGLMNTDIIINLTYSNVALLGRALCYLKNRRDRLWSLANLPDAPVVDGELQELCAFFSLQSTSQVLSIKIFDRGEPRLSSIFEAEKRSKSASWKLLIARPRHKNGRIKGVHFFDVGRERRVAPLKTQMPIILQEDERTFHDIATFLKFCARNVTSVRSMVRPTSPVRQVMNNSNFEDGDHQDAVQPAAAGLNDQAKGAHARPLTLFERTLKLSFERDMLTADTPGQRFRDQDEQPCLGFGAEPRSTSKALYDSGTGRVQHLNGDANTKGVDHFGDDAFRDFCKSLMETEPDADDDSDVIVLDGPPADVSFVSMSESEGDESDDLILLEGPPPNVRFDRRTGSSQDQRFSPDSAQPPAKRARLMMPYEDVAAKSKESTCISHNPEYPVGGTNRAFIGTPEEDGRHRLRLHLNGDDIASLNLQELSAEPVASPSHPREITALPARAASRLEDNQGFKYGYTESYHAASESLSYLAFWVSD